MKYYLHDSNAFQDEKITELFMKFGYEGLGLFYTTLEKLAAQEKPIKTDVLKAQLKVGKRLDKCWSFMESLGILSSNNGETFNKQLLNYSQKYLIKKEKNKERVSQWRENQDNTETVTHYESVRNTPKDNISKVKESKVKVVKQPTTLFRDSLYSDLEKFEISFAGTDYESFNLKYYHEKVLNWSDSSNSKKIDWIATARNFMLGDAQQNKAVYKNTNLSNNGKQDANGRKIVNADNKQRLAREMEEYYRKVNGQSNSGD